MSLRDLMRAARDASTRVLAHVERNAVAHVRLDGRRLFVSDAALHAAVKMIADRKAPDLALAIESQPRGHLLRLTAGGEPVSALLVLEAVHVAQGTVRVVIGTPDGVSLDARPVVEFFAGTVAQLFGGTTAGRAILSSALPECLRWDGHRAVLEAPIDGVPRVGAHLAALELSATVNRDGAGNWLVFDRDGVAGELAAAILRGAIGLGPASRR